MKKKRVKKGEKEIVLATEVASSSCCSENAVVNVELFWLFIKWSYNYVTLFLSHTGYQPVTLVNQGYTVAGYLPSYLDPSLSERLQFYTTPTSWWPLTLLSHDSTLTGGIDFKNQIKPKTKANKSLQQFSDWRRRIHVWCISLFQRHHSAHFSSLLFFLNVTFDEWDLFILFIS